MALKSEQVSKLAEVFGDRLVTAKHEMIIHSQDVGSLPKQVSRLMNTEPDAIVQPESPEEIQSLYEFARSQKVPHVPRDAGT